MSLSRYWISFRKPERRKSLKVSRLHSRYADLPRHGLKAKKAEIDNLLDPLDRDAKGTIVTDHSNREEVLSEAVKSSAEWLSDIWSVSYEYTSVSLLRMCLMCTAEMLERIGTVRGEFVDY
jgi:hypothetical protein